MLPTVLCLQFQPGKPALNAAGLCELHQFIREEDVPIEHFRICADGKEIDAHVGPGRYQTALLLFHLMASSPNYLPRFYLTRTMQFEGVLPYYDFVRQPTGIQPPGNDAVMGPILFKATACWIELELKPGYERHLATFRTPEEVVNFAWEHHKTLDFSKPCGMLRRSLAWFFEQAESTKEHPSSTKPDPELAGKILFLSQRINAMSTTPVHS